MRQPFVAGNWKMNGNRASAATLVAGVCQGISQCQAEVAVCPPFVYLEAVAEMLKGKGLLLGAQNLCGVAGPGAYTGEISAAMLTDLGCRYVIVGHSERRALYAETDQCVADKFSVARNAGLRPILCVGETLAEREQGQTEAVVARQLDAVLNATDGVSGLVDAVIAYEPVWAIGTGMTATPAQAQEVHAFVRQRIAGHDAAIADNIRILYGGSVKSANAEELFAMTDIDGGLIGGASLQADEFVAICRAAG